MKKCFLFFIMIFININVYASTYIDKIDSTIFVAKSGLATVSEKWTINIDENYNNDELCRKINLLSGSKIKNLQVIENSYNYQIIDTWNSNISSEDKAYKANISDNIICFSLNNYGNNTYTIRYDIENFAYFLNDSDLVYLNDNYSGINLPINNISIKLINSISKDYLEKVDNSSNVKISYDEDNIIISGSNVNKDIIVTLKYQKGSFENLNSIDNIYEEYAAHKNNNKIVITIVIFVIIGVICLLFIKKSKK